MSEIKNIVIIHTGTGVTVERFYSVAEAQAWMDGYRVSQSYKDQYYRIVGS
jgi:hypothetical protein